MPTIANLNDASKLELIAVRDGAINVDYYGAAGDGVTNDNDALDSAITAAGANGILTFTKNKTYLIDKQLTPLAGQTWIGYGATIKRADRVGTLLTGGFSGNTLPVTPGEGTNFRVGSAVAIWDTPDETDHSTNLLFVVSTTANSVTLSGGSFTGITAASGDALETATGLIASAADGVKIIGFTIDGNGASYTTGTGLHAWEVHKDIALSGDRSYISEVYFLNAQLEALIFAGDGSQIVNSWFVTPGGNAIHLSASNGLVIDDCYIFGSQAENDDVQNHQDGAISCSTDVIDTVVSNVYVDGNSTSLALVGGIDETTERMTITGCTAIDTTDGPITASGTFNNTSSGHIFADNYFQNAGTFSLNDNSGSKNIRNVLVTDNIFLGTKIVIDEAIGVSFVDNFLDFTGVTGTAIAVSQADYVQFKGNNITSATGLVLMNFTTSGTAANIEGNLIKGHIGSSNMFNFTAFTNSSIIGNQITSGTDAVNAPSAINISVADVEVSNNVIDWTGITGGSNIGIQINGVADVRVKGNTVKMAAGKRALVATPGSDGLQLTGNYLDGLTDPRGSNCHIGNNQIRNGILYITGVDSTIVNNTIVDADLILLANADTNFVDGNRVEGAGKSITVTAGATGNVVTNNATTVAISDGGTSTVLTSQNHVL